MSDNGYITDDDIMTHFNIEFKKLKKKLINESDNSYQYLDQDYIDCTIVLEAAKIEKV